MGTDVYKVSAGRETYFLRISPASPCKEEEIAGEIAILTHLAQQGVSVTEAVPMRNGRYVGAVRAPEGKRFTVLYTQAKGATIHDAAVSDDQARAFGRIAAQMHRSLDAMRTMPCRDHMDLRHLVAEPLGRIDACGMVSGKDRRYLRSAGKALAAIIGSLLDLTPPLYGLCHGDLHTGNAAFDGRNRPTLMDFENCGYGWRAYDISFFLGRTAQGWTREARSGRSRRWHSFLEGYLAERTLAGEELKAAWVFPVARQIHGIAHLVSHVVRYQGTAAVTRDRLVRAVQFVRDWAKGTRL